MTAFRCFLTLHNRKTKEKFKKKKIRITYTVTVRSIKINKNTVRLNSYLGKEAIFLKLGLFWGRGDKKKVHYKKYRGLFLAYVHPKRKWMKREGTVQDVCSQSRAPIGSLRNPPRTALNPDIIFFSSRNNIGDRWFFGVLKK